MASPKSQFKVKLPVLFQTMFNDQSYFSFKLTL